LIICSVTLNCGTKHQIELFASVGRDIAVIASGLLHEFAKPTLFAGLTKG
jgi:hypothetical protein